MLGSLCGILVAPLLIYGQKTLSPRDVAPHDAMLPLTTGLQVSTAPTHGIPRSREWGDSSTKPDSWAFRPVMITTTRAAIDDDLLQERGYTSIDGVLDRRVSEAVGNPGLWKYTAGCSPL